MRSIERYLMAWVMGALSLGAVLIVLTTYLVTLDELNEVFDADLKNVAEALGGHHQGLWPDEPARLRPPRRLPRQPASAGAGPADPADIVTLTWTLDAELVFTSDPRVSVPFSRHEALQELRIGGEDWLVYTDVGADGVAQAAQRMAARRGAAAESASKILLPTVLMVLLVAGLLVVALRRGLTPLDLAAQDVASRSAASLAPIATDELPREILPLVDAINGLMLRLAHALATQREFLADAAHELRSPVTALRLQLQLLQRAVDDSGRAEAVAELAAGIQRAQRLIEQLLLVARFEPDGERGRREPVDLGALVRSVVGRYSVQAEHAGIDLGAAASDGVVVSGDLGQLTTLLNNLVENALRYTPAGGVVDVSAALDQGQPLLQVVDNGPGIAEAERALAFKRFHRGPLAATQARDAAGSGLGLAIVQAVAELHGATVSLHTAPSGQGLAVRLRFGTDAGAGGAAAAAVAPAVAPGTTLVDGQR